MKRTILTLVIIAVVIAFGVMLCVPLIESYDPGVQYVSFAYAGTNGIMEGLCIGDIETAQRAIYREKAVPDLTEKLERYMELIGDRLHAHIGIADFTLEGNFPTPPYSETSYVEIRMDDGSVLYAVVVWLQDANGGGVIDFDLYTECPW